MNTQNIQKIKDLLPNDFSDNEKEEMVKNLIELAKIYIDIQKNN